MAGYFSLDPAFAVSWTGTKKLEGNFTDSVHCSDSAAYPKLLVERKPFEKPF